MELLLYAVIFSMILIVSNATNKLVPSLPLPLIQILLGIGWALFVPEENFHLDTELFLALGHWPSLISRGRRSRYYFRLKALADHPLFDFPSDFYLNY